jgi:RNA polymerase sigma factor (sigma-70 family)
MQTLLTRPSLLLRVRDLHDAGSWREFVGLYAPLVHSYFTRRGMQPADADDITQETLRIVAREMPRFEYDPARGQFRGWLRTVARTQLAKFFARADRQRLADGSSAAWREAEAHADDTADAQKWEHEYRARLFAWAAEKVRAEVAPATWEAFWRTAVLDESPEHVAKSVGLGTGNVYVARSRITARIRAVIAETDESWEQR